MNNSRSLRLKSGLIVQNEKSPSLSEPLTRPEMAVRG